MCCAERDLVTSDDVSSASVQASEASAARDPATTEGVDAHLRRVANHLNTALPQSLGVVVGLQMLFYVSNVPAGLSSVAAILAGCTVYLSLEMRAWRKRADDRRCLR